jgi:hypothetical protein
MMIAALVSHCSLSYSEFSVVANGGTAIRKKTRFSQMHARWVQVLAEKFRSSRPKKEVMLLCVDFEGRMYESFK